MNVKEQIRFYLENTDALYKKWHLKQIQHETGVYVGEPLGKLEDHKKAFSNWLESNKETLRQIICPNVDDIKRSKGPIDIIVSIMVLIEELSFVGGVIEAASLLFVYGLEKLCKRYELRKD